MGRGKKDYALIYGTVWGADGRALGGIPIKIQRVGDKKPKWELVSDRRGEFAQRVPPGEGDYIVIADIKHPKDGKKPGNQGPHYQQRTRGYLATFDRVEGLSS